MTVIKKFSIEYFTNLPPAGFVHGIVVSSSNPRPRFTDAFKQLAGFRIPLASWDS